MSFLDEIINHKFKDDSGSLCEKGNDSIGRTFTMKCKIKHENIKYELYKFDKSKVELFPYFDDVRDLKKMNDYVLIFDKEEVINILLIELKKSMSRGCIKQLDAGECFVRFLIHSYNRICSENNDKIEEKDIKLKKILITDSPKKRKTAGRKYFNDDQAKKQGYYRHLNPKTFDFFQYS